ncbi:VirB3 family type IV secretion system protein [Pseudomonas sp. PSPC3-3]|uniref:VirB3 family type IV secretion system protein n=1 Tax=unclassified Pseudomonas TaxID=196821 RepID=UPI003CF1BFD8
MSDEKPLLFDSYNAMSRPAMYWGVPIMPMLGLVMATLVGFGIGAAIFDWVWGLIFAFPFLLALPVLRFFTSIDDRYMRRIRFALRRLRLNIKHGKNLLLTSYNPKWSQYYGKRFAQKRYVSGGDGKSDEVPRS